jgi:hypothetical protein
MKRPRGNTDIPRIDEPVLGSVLRSTLSPLKISRTKTFSLGRLALADMSETPE